jgi:hypothetical protein
LPSPGDVFLDLEADIFVGEGGFGYLFGLLLVEDGRPVYREVWAHSLEEERAAFCSFMDRATLCLDPTWHLLGLA